MNIISAANPRWLDAEQTRIDLDIETDKFGTIPFTASPNDSEKYGRDLFAAALAGDYGAIAAFVPKVKTPAQIAAEESAQAKRELAALDLASIPLLRTYIASKADAPQELKDMESAAALKKLKVK